MLRIDKQRIGLAQMRTSDVTCCSQGAAVGVANFRLVRQMWIQPEAAMRMRGAALSAISSTAASVSQHLRT